MDSNSNLESAQIYLESYIIPKGYSEYQFIQFLSTRKTNGNDLTLWNMDELIQVGNDFIQNTQPDNLVNFHVPEVSQNTPIAKSVSNPIQYESQSVPMMQQSAYNYPSVANDELIRRKTLSIKDSQFLRYVVNPGKQIQPNPEAFLQKHPNINVEVAGFEEQSGSLFQKSYIAYKIVLNPYGYVITRRYSDFDKLRDYLVKNYPEYIIPPIPEKATSGRQPKVVNYRQRSLQRFLNLIVKGFWFDQCVDGFFGSMNDAELQKSFKNAPTRVYDSKNTATLSGQIECQISQQIDNFYAQQQLLMDKNGDIFKKIQDLSKKVVEDHKNIQNDLKELSGLYQTLQNGTKLWNETLPEKIDDTPYRLLTNLFSTWSNKYEQINEGFTNNLYSFYKYQNQILDIVKDKIKVRDQQRDEIQKSQLKLEQKKDKLFREQNISKWELNKDILKQYHKDTLLQNEKLAKELMLPNEVKLQEYMLDNYGYLNNNLYLQIQYATSYALSQNMVSVKRLITQIGDVYTELINEFTTALN